MEVRAINVYSPGEQHYHVLLGEEPLPYYNLSFDRFDAAADTFFMLVNSYCPEFFEFTDEEAEVREHLMDKVIESTMEEPCARIMVAIGSFKIGFIDCYGCLLPHYN